MLPPMKCDGYASCRESLSHSSHGNGFAPVRDTSLAVDVPLCRKLGYLCLSNFSAFARYISVAESK